MLSVLAGYKRPVAGDLRILVRVAQHGGRGVSVDDRDRLALTGHPGLGHVIGPPNLARRITAVRPRLGLTISEGLLNGDLLAVETGARPRGPVVLAWGRELVGRPHVMSRRVQSADCQHVGREAGGHGRLLLWCAVGLVVGAREGPERNAERLRRGLDRPACLDITRNPIIDRGYGQAGPG